MLKGRVHKYGARELKGLRPFNKFSSLSPYEGERDKG